MSIIGAVKTGVEVGVAVHDFVINYTKGEYEARISELEALIARLNEHLTSLNNYRSQVPQFWDDENAQDTCRALDTTIARVEREMATAQDLARTFKTTVSSMDTAKDKVKNLINDAMGILKAIED